MAEHATRTRLTCLLLASALTGCTTQTIFKDYFDSYQTGTMPNGSVPGAPGNDSIDAYVAELADQGKPFSNVKVTEGVPPTIEPITGVGKSLGFWPYNSPADGNGTVRMTSRVVAGGSAKRLNVFFDGKKFDSNARFECDLLGNSGQPGGLHKVMTLRLDGNTIKTTDPAPYFQTAGNLSTAQPGQDAPRHEVFIAFNPSNNTYSLRITLHNNNVIAYDGATPTGAGSLFENNSARLLLYCAQNATGTSATPTYMLDRLRMRVKPK